MSHEPGTHPVPTRADEIRHAQQKRQQRALIARALVEGAVLAVAVIAIFVLELIDPAVGIWVLVGIALLGGGALSTYLMISMQRNQRERSQLEG